MPETPRSSDHSTTEETSGPLSNSKCKLTEEKRSVQLIRSDRVVKDFCNPILSVYLSSVSARKHRRIAFARLWNDPSELMLPTLHILSTLSRMKRVLQHTNCLIGSDGYLETESTKLRV